MAGLFETIRVRDGQVPFLERHAARLAASCRALGQAPPRAGLAERVLGYATGELVVRVTLEGPAERIETRAVPPGGALRVAFSDVPHEPYPHKVTERGVFERAGARAAAHRADEVVLLTPDGLVAEGTVTSVFFWQHDALCTPALELGILPGVGRARVLELARERGVPVREGRFTPDDCAGAPLFLVNAVRGVVETAAGGPGRPEDVRTALLARSFWG